MGRRGRRPVSDRAVLSAMVWRLRHGGGGEWPAALLGFKTSQVLWRRCREWKELGAWEPIRVALERELPDSAALDFSRFPLAWSSVRRQALNGRQRQLLCRLQGERALAIRGREYASAGGITPGLAMLELRELVRRELLVGRCRRRPFWFWAPRDLCARLVVQGMDALVVGDDADWRPVSREWTGDRPLEVLRVICEQRAVEVGLLARICGLETAELGDALVDLYRRRLIDSEQLAVGDWPWVWPRRRGALLVEAVRWGRPSEQELPLLQAANAARALFAERCRDGEWVAAEELRVDMRAAEVARVPTAVLEVMGADGLLRRHAIEVDVASASRASCVEDAVAAYAEHYDVVDLVCGPDAASSARAARPAGVEVWELPAPPPSPVRADEEGWLSELEEAAPGDKRRGWRYPLRVYEGRQRVHLPGGPAVVYGVELSSLPGAARSAIAEVVGSEEDAHPLEVWKKDGGGKQVFCVRTTSAVFRVVGGAGRWRADEVLADGVFDKRPRRSAPKRRRLPARGPKPVYEIDVEEFPSAGVEAVRVTAEAADPLVPRAVWQSFGGGAQIYCVECAAGAFRVVRSRWGWRADRVGQGVFLKHGRHERPIGARLRTVVYELEPEAVPTGLGEALVAARGGAEVEVRRVWRRPRTRFVYCVETAEGTFRAQRDSRWGWQVEPAAEAEFDRRPGPMPGPDPKCHIVEPERFEVDDEVWERIEPSIPEPGGSRLHRGKVVYSDRAIVSGLLYFLRNDLSSWRRLPTELGFGTQWACPRRVGRWENLGVWEQIRAVLERELPDGSQLDFSRVRGRRR